jgi:ArsR family transcriptional regulator, arsenate/arsenite/antimonite-responsive transcriptional repressor
MGVSGDRTLEARSDFADIPGICAICIRALVVGKFRATKIFSFAHAIPISQVVKTHKLDSMNTIDIHPSTLMNPSLEMLKALANDVRFEIVSMLAQRECCVCDLEASLGLGQSKVSYHLAVLLGVGLVSNEQRGKNVFYKLERGALYRFGGHLLEALLRPRSDLLLTHQTESIC